MESNSEKYQDLQPFVQQEIKTMFNTLYQQEATKYGVSSTPLHRHNGADSPTLPAASLDPFLPLPATKGGIANPTVLNGEKINDTNQANNPQLAGSTNSATIYVDPLPLIYGTGTQGFNGGSAPYGTIVIFANPLGDTATGSGVELWVRANAAPNFSGGTFHFTGGISSGATSGTLNAAWTEPSGTYSIVFSDGEQRFANFTNGSTAVTWAPGLASNVTAIITVSGVGWYGFTPDLLIPS